MNSSGITDSLLIEMKKMVFNVSGLPIPDTLLVDSDTTGTNVTENIKKKSKFNLPDFPKIPTKIKALMMSLQYQVADKSGRKKYPGYGFLVQKQL